MKFPNFKNKISYFPNFIKYLLFFLILILCVNFFLFFFNKQKETKEQNLIIKNNSQIKKDQLQELFFFLKNIGNTRVFLQEVKNFNNTQKSEKENLLNKLETLINENFIEGYLNLSGKKKTRNQDITSLPFPYQAQNWTFPEKNWDYQANTTPNSLAWEKRFKQNFQINNFVYFIELKKRLEKIQSYLNLVSSINEFEIFNFDTMFYKQNTTPIRKILNVFFQNFDSIQKNFSALLQRIQSVGIDLKDLPKTLFKTMEILNTKDYIKDQASQKTKYQNFLILTSKILKNNAFINEKKCGIKSGCDFYLKIKKYSLEQIINDSQLIDSLMREKTLEVLKAEIHELVALNLVKNFWNIFSKDAKDIQELLDEKNQETKLKDILKLSVLNENLFILQLWFFDYLILTKKQMPKNFNESLSEFLVYLIDFDFDYEGFIGAQSIINAIDTILFTTESSDTDEEENEDQTNDLISSNTLKNFLNNPVFKELFKGLILEKYLLKYLKNFQQNFFYRDVAIITRFFKLLMPKISLNEITNFSKKQQIKERLNQKWNIFWNFIQKNTNIFKDENDNELPIPSIELNKGEEFSQFFSASNQEDLELKISFNDKTFTLKLIKNEKNKVSYAVSSSDATLKWEDYFTYMSAKNKDNNNFWLRRNYHDNRLPRKKSKAFVYSSDLEQIQIQSKKDGLKIEIMNFNQKNYFFLLSMEKFVSFFKDFINDFALQFSIFKNWNFMSFIFYQTFLSNRLKKTGSREEVYLDIIKSFANFLDNKTFTLLMQKILSLTQNLAKTTQQFMFAFSHLRDFATLENDDNALDDKGIYRDNALVFEEFKRILGLSVKVKNKLKEIDIKEKSFIQELLQLLNPDYFLPDSPDKQLLIKFWEEKLINENNISKKLIQAINKYLEQNFYFYLNFQNWEYKNFLMNNFVDFMRKKAKTINIQYDAIFKLAPIPFKFQFIWKIDISKNNEYIFTLVKLKKIKLN